MQAQSRHEGETMSGSRPPAYDEIDRAMAPDTKIDLKTFLQESRLKPHELGSKKLPPQYDCTVSYSGTVLRKFESVINPKGFVEYPYRRNWTRVFAVVRGTMLEIYRTSSASNHSGSLPDVAVYNSVNASVRRASSLPPNDIDERLPSRSRSSSTPSRYTNVAPLELLQSYSLAGVVVGIANDYIKKDNVLRVRAENDQFLVHCRGSQEAIEWLETLQKAANIAEPLESRVEPRFYVTPRRSRIPSRQQAYEVFESIAPNAPLRQKSYISIWPQSRFTSDRHTRTSANGNATATRQSRRTISTNTPRRSNDARPSSSSLNSVSRAVTNDGLTPSRPSSTDAIRPAPVGAQCHITPRSAMTSAGKNNPVRNVPTPQRPIKAERYICAILPSTHPRYVMTTAPTISC